MFARGEWESLQESRELKKKKKGPRTLYSLSPLQNSRVCIQSSFFVVALHCLCCLEFSHLVLLFLVLSWVPCWRVTHFLGLYWYLLLCFLLKWIMFSWVLWHLPVIHSIKVIFVMTHYISLMYL